MKFKFKAHSLEGGFCFYTGQLPEDLQLTPKEFEKLWSLHPDDFHEIKIHGKLVKTPRWQQAYIHDYHYTGKTNQALPLPEILQSLYVWMRKYVYKDLNGVLINWYDGKLKHYIGKHRDSIKNMTKGAPIYTISFGEERAFRLRSLKGSGFIDVPIPDGSIIELPFDTNLAYTHEVPWRKSYTDKRISVTFRAFNK